MRIFKGLLLTATTFAFASSAFAGTYLCAAWQAFNADLSQAKELGGSKCVVADAFHYGNMNLTGVDTKNGADIAADFENTGAIATVLETANLTALSPEGLDASAFFLVDGKGRCLGTNLSAAMPKLDKIGNTQCWIFHISQD